MIRAIAILLAVLVPTLIPRAAPAADELPPVTSWIPPDAVLVVEISQPKALLDKLLDPKVEESIVSLPAYKKLASGPGFLQFRGLLGLFEARMGTDWKTALRDLASGGVTFATKPDGAVLLFLDARDRKTLDRVQDFFLDLTKADAAKQGRPEQVASKEYRGTATWTFGPNEAHAIVGNRLILANRSDALEGALDLRAEAGGRCLASSSTYKVARKAAGDAVITAYVNLTILKLYPPVAKALSEASNPMSSLLFAGVTEALQASSWLAMALRLDGAGLALQAMVDGGAKDTTGPASFSVPRAPDQGALPILTVPRRIAGLTLFRDLHGFYAKKDELFPERTSGLIFFENMMGIFFSGMDLTEEVLAEAGPEIRLVVAGQEYDPAVGTPRVQIPAFAAVFRLRHPEKFGEVVEEAWQKALGLVNFTRGQQALPGLVIDKVSRGDTKFSVAYFRAPKTGEKKDLEIGYNFRPALARTGDSLILSSSDGLASDLIDALKKEAAAPAKPIAAATSLLELDGAQLTSILRANRENMLLQNMTEKGNTREQAASEIDLLMDITEFLAKARLGLSSPEGRPRASLELEFKAPGGRREILRRGEGGAPRQVASGGEGESIHGR